MSLRFPKFFVSGFLALGMAGCSSVPEVDDVLPDRKVEYKKSKQAENDLEVPPDLTRSSINDSLMIPGLSGYGTTTFSEFTSKEPVAAGSGIRGSVIPKIDDIRVKRDGDQRWLVIKAEPDDVWPRVVDFWQESGILMVEQDPSVGVMVTDWLENRADIKSDFITDSVRQFFDGAYSAATRDQYRIRLERGAEEGTVELFLTHRGMQEEIVSGATGDETERSVWVPRGTDHGLEAEMLRRLMAYMGVSDQTARRSLAKKSASASSRSQLHRGRDQVSLSVKEEFSRAWRLTGVALDRVGFAVEDRNRSQGIYFVRYNDPLKENEDRGLLSKMAFWRDDNNIDKESRYQVKLNSKGEVTNIVILSEKGVRENSDTAVRILTLLHEQMR